MKALLRKLGSDKAGASAAEYTFTLAVIGAAVAVAFAALGGAVETKVTATKTLIESGVE